MYKWEATPYIPEFFGRGWHPIEVLAAFDNRFAVKRPAEQIRSMLRITANFLLSARVLQLSLSATRPKILSEKIPA